MLTIITRSWSGDTPTPTASTSGSSSSTLTVVEPGFLSKCDLGEAFELTYWAAIQRYWQEEPEQEFIEQYDLKHGKEDQDSFNSFELVEVALDDESDIEIKNTATHVGLIDRVHRWWGSNVSMIIPEDQELRDHFCRPIIHLSFKWRGTVLRRLRLIPFCEMHQL